jgi:biotin synthase-related radical SAM superfamily protein
MSTVMEDRHDWLRLMERSKSDFGKTNLQAFTDLAVEVMEKTLCVKGEAEEGNPLLLLFF